VELFKNHKEVLIILALSAFIVLSAGLTSELYLGDEVCHYRFAKDMYAAGKRVAFDPVYATGNPPGYFYSSEPLWSGLLAILWRCVGKVSFPVAQIYHTFYYLSLILLTYLLGIHIYGKKEGVYAALLISSIPMIVSFGIIFYLDVPGCAFAALSLLLFVKRRYLLAGLAISLMYFTRRNGCFLVPGFIVVLLVLGDGKLLVKLKNMACLILPAGILGLIDMRWRSVHIEGVKYKIAGVVHVTDVIGVLPTAYQFNNINYYIKDRLHKLLWGSGEYLNSSLFRPGDLIQYFGVAILAGLILYLFFKRDKGKDLPILIYFVPYLLLFAYFFGLNSDIRYLMPVVPLLCVLASSALKTVESSKWIRLLVWVVCVVQLLTTSLYVHQRRLMPSGMKEAFNFIKENTPAGALFMYPGYIFIEATGRKFIWSSFFLMEGLLLMQKYQKNDFEDKSNHLFWAKNEKDIKEIMKLNEFDYIVVDKTKIYDDTKVKNFGGYPKSFIERLHTFPFLENIFDNREISIWEVKRGKQRDVFQIRKEHG
jgi:4-amino-4-deoxy-L-arabinose transferase-like glycosyltransferase